MESDIMVKRSMPETTTEYYACLFVRKDYRGFDDHELAVAHMFADGEPLIRHTLEDVNPLDAIGAADVGNIASNNHDLFFEKFQDVCGWQARKWEIHLVPKNLIQAMSITNRFDFDGLLKTTGQEEEMLKACADIAERIRKIDNIQEEPAPLTTADVADKPKKKKRSQNDIKILIESAVDAYGDKKADKFYAEQSSIQPSVIARQPYSTFLEEAKKKYQKQRKFEEQTKKTYDDRWGYSDN